MQVLYAVLDDLFQFTLRSLFGSVTWPEKKDFVDTAAPLQPLLPLTVQQHAHSTPVATIDAHGSNFVQVDTTPLRIDPVAAFDNVRLNLPYGTQVTVLKYGGRWAYAEVGEEAGWILKDDLVNAAADVLPSFSVGSVYEAHDPQTVKLRHLINDEFNCTAAELPLTSAEYVSYRLARVRRHISWPSKRPRVPGRWQHLLRGCSGVHIGVIPKTGSVMEYAIEELGHLLYVEAVYPDQSIQLSGIDHEGSAVYSESVLDKDVWRELRPVFIEVM